MSHTSSSVRIPFAAGMPEGKIPLAEATLYLACAAKSNSSVAGIGSPFWGLLAGLGFLALRWKPRVVDH